MFSNHSPCPPEPVCQMFQKVCDKKKENLVSAESSSLCVGEGLQTEG